MNKYFRTAVLTVILAGGTLASYTAAYAVMAATSDPAIAMAARPATPVAVKRLPAGQTDISVREACSVFAGDARTHCVQTNAAGPRAVRVIDFASGETSSIVR